MDADLRATTPESRALARGVAVRVGRASLKLPGQFAAHREMLESEAWLGVLLAARSYDPARGEWAPYARHLAAQRCRWFVKSFVFRRGGLVAGGGPGCPPRPRVVEFDAARGLPGRHRAEPDEGPPGRVWDELPGLVGARAAAVLGMLYRDGLTVAEAARRAGVCPLTVARCRRAALGRLARLRPGWEDYL